MICNGCGNAQAYRSTIWSEKNEQGEIVTLECCDRCGQTGSAFVPDVYWDGKPEINLADDPVTGQPRTFASKGEKARYLQERGLCEAGDKFHGAPFTGVTTKTNNNREIVRNAIKWAKGLGIDQRRQELLKIQRAAEKQQGGRTR